MTGIVVRVADSDADLEAWRQVRIAVLPNERALPVEEMRAMMTPETEYLLAELDGAVAGSGLGGRSSFDYAGLHPRVLPTAPSRRRKPAFLIWARRGPARWPSHSSFSSISLPIP